MAVRQLPPRDVLIRHADIEGWTYQRIADHYGVTRAAVSQQFLAMGRSPARVKYDEVFPWRINRRHLTEYPARMLRLAARRSQGKSITEAEARRLDQFLARMNPPAIPVPVVVTYDYETGFDVAPRVPADGDSLVRRPGVDPNGDVAADVG